MTKKKAVLKIRSYKDGLLLLEADDLGVRTLLKGVVDLCEKKYGGWIQLEVSPPYKKRTTGAGSQNNLIWRLITEIARETGNELEDVEAAAKERAVARGYPFRQNRLTGRPVPASMTEIDVAEAGLLIDELHSLAAELGIIVEGE